jgi:putative nucleotidyltransferase with HDIG domain
MNQRERIIEALQTVPELPGAATQVMKLIQDPNAGVADIMKPIEFDPGLTSNVLRLANSAYFAGPRTISSLREAGVRLGAQRIFQLVLASAVSPVARLPVQNYDIPAGQLFEHLIAVAVGAEELANTLGITPPAHTFTTGLLHDVGKVVMGTFAGVEAAPIFEHALREGISFERAEKELLGIDHAEAGALLLRHWQLPDEITEAVQWHHEPERYPGDNTLVVDLVHVAVNLSMQCGIGTGADGLHYQPSQVVAKRLALRTRMMEEVSAKMLTGLAGLRPLMTPEGGN